MPRGPVRIGDTILEASVEGDGPLTVVFENGLATPLEEWDAVAAQVATRARVLRYDHREAPLQGTVAVRSISDLLADLEALLGTLALKPPYVFVGHSWGGVIARLFAHAHPGDVVGAVLVDATHEALDARTLAIVPVMFSLMSVAGRARFVRRALAKQLCPPGSSAAHRARIEDRLNDPVRWPIGLRTARAESAAIPDALNRLRRDCPELPPIPVHVLTAATVKSSSARRVHEAWKALVARTPTARYTSVPCGHHIPIERPDAVVDAIVGLLESIPTERASYRLSGSSNT